MFKFGNKVASAAIAVVLAAGMIPSPAFAISETRAGGGAAASLSGDVVTAVGAQATSGQLTRKGAGDAASARAAVASAQARVDAAQAAVDEGSFGFFAAARAQDALDALENAPYASETRKGDPNDATSLENLRAAVKMVEKGNQIRNTDGLPAMLITHYLMAAAESNANCSTVETGHRQQFPIGENLAFVPTWYDLGNATNQAYEAWYSEEKALFVNAPDGGRYEANGKVYTLPYGWRDMTWNERTDDVNQLYYDAGHYLALSVNIVSYTGGGIRVSSEHEAIMSQTFLDKTTDRAYTTAEYSAMVESYCDKVYGELEAAKAELASAQAALAAAEGGSGGEIALAAERYAYTGSAIEPAVRVTFGGAVLAQGRDYTVSYASNVRPGTATVTVTGTGDYGGTMTATFEIAPATHTVSFDSAGGTAVPSQQVEDGKGAAVPANPTRAGYSFAGWMLGGSAYRFGRPVTENITLTAAWEPAAREIAMYRLYNPATSEHFYTADAYEKGVCISKWGWEDEGIGWYAPSTGDPVYRLCNLRNSDHHYTMSAYERDVLAASGEWRYEGVGWYSDAAKTVPMYREYRRSGGAGSHNYTADWNEHFTLTRVWRTWDDEGIGWYALRWR